MGSRTTIDILLGIETGDAPPEAEGVPPDRRVFGALLGLLAGVSFALSIWGYDAYELSKVHAFLPWLKLGLGLLLWGLVGMAAGWSASFQDKIAIKLVIWLAACGLLSWATIGVPLQLAPAIAKWANPTLGSYMNYELGGGLIPKLFIALTGIVIFLAIPSILQTSQTDSSVFTSSIFSRVDPILLCVLLAALGGLMLDNLINAPLRRALEAVNSPVQFVLDHSGQSIEPKVASKYHLGALKNITGEISESRNTIVTSFSENFVQVYVLVQFQDVWVSCLTVNGQASVCKLAEPVPLPGCCVLASDQEIPGILRAWSPPPFSTPKSHGAMRDTSMTGVPSG